MNGFDRLRDDVIARELCLACGACVGVCPRECLEFDQELEEPVLREKCKPCGICYAVCPGLDVPFPDLEKMLFGGPQVHDMLGYHTRKLKGYAVDPSVRQVAASGGCTTSLLLFALEKGIIDGAIVAGFSAAKPWRAEGKLATTASEIVAAAQSKYVLVPNLTMLGEAQRRGLRSVAVVGPACQVHAIRKMQLLGKPNKLTTQIKLALGIFCGYNISRMATEHVIAKMGIPLEDIVKYEYRGGKESQNRMVTTRDGRAMVVPPAESTRATSQLVRDRCSMCIDFPAELADVSSGDVWLPGSLSRKVPKLSAVLVRTKEGEALMEGAEKSGYFKSADLPLSGFAHNPGLEIKKYYSPFHLLRRKRLGLPIPDYHFNVECPPDEHADPRDFIRQQIAEIPEVAEWVAKTPSLRDAISALDRNMNMRV